MDIGIDKDNNPDEFMLYFGVPALYKRNSSLPNKSTFRDFYPYELRPNENNLKEIRKAIASFIEKGSANGGNVVDNGLVYRLHYNGVDYSVPFMSIVNAIAFLIEDHNSKDTEEFDKGPPPLLLNPFTQAFDKYHPATEGEGYYKRNSPFIPTNYLIEKFLTIEGKYISEFDYHFGFPVSFLMGLFSYKPDDLPYPSGKKKIPFGDSLKKASEFFLNTPFSLKNFSGVSAFLESTTRMILMDTLDSIFNQYEKGAIERVYWNTKVSGLDEGDVEMDTSIFLNMLLDILYMAMHSNYYAIGGTQSKYIENIRNTFPDEYEVETGDIKFMDPRYGFHPETVASYALYPFITMIYAGFLSGFSPSTMINYGQTVFRTFVVKQLRWFRYAWHPDNSASTHGYFWYSHRDHNVWACHNLVYFATRMKAFKVTPADIDFMREVMVTPLETFVNDYDSNGEVRAYANDKDRVVAGAYLEYTKAVTDWLDMRISDDDLHNKFPNVIFDTGRVQKFTWAEGPDAEGMVAWLQSFLHPYVKEHLETGYSPLPQLFSNRGLFKHDVHPYMYTDRKDGTDFSKWAELEFYSKIFEHNPILHDMSMELDLLSPPLTQAVDEIRFKILLEDTGLIGDVARVLLEYYTAGFNPRLPFRPLPLMVSTPREGFNFYSPANYDVTGVEELDIPMSFSDEGNHLTDILGTSDRILDIVDNVSEPRATKEEIIKNVNEIGNGLSYHPFDYNYYYNLASNTGNFLYNGSPAIDINTGDKAPLVLSRMNKVMFDRDYGVGDDRVYMKNLPLSWFSGDTLNDPYFNSDRILDRFNNWQLFKKGFLHLLDDGDVMLLSSDDYKKGWSEKHGGASPNAYQYCEEI